MYTELDFQQEVPRMKTLLVYDTLYGNTEQIAKAIAAGIGGEVKLVKVKDANPADAPAYDMLVAGAPTQGGRQTAAMKAFLDMLPADAVKNKPVAAFDTRLKTPLVKMFGYAAQRIADELKKKGGKLIVPPEAFQVKGAKGPLADGALEKATDWGKSIVAAQKASADPGAGLLDRP
jgi:flavodoxin I